MRELLQTSRTRATRYYNCNRYGDRASILGFLNGCDIFWTQWIRRPRWLAVDVYVSKSESIREAKANTSSICGCISVPSAMWTAVAIPQLPARAKPNWSVPLSLLV
jgi:hypothetical protein